MRILFYRQVMGFFFSLIIRIESFGKASVDGNAVDRIGGTLYFSAFLRLNVFLETHPPDLTSDHPPDTKS